MKGKYISSHRQNCQPQGAYFRSCKLIYKYDNKENRADFNLWSFDSLLTHKQFRKYLARLKS